MQLQAANTCMPGPVSLLDQGDTQYRHLDSMLVEAMTQVGQTVLKAVNMHRQSYPVGMLCSMIKPVYCLATCMTLDSFLCNLRDTTNSVYVTMGICKQGYR